MKKLLSFLLVPVCLLFCAAGCGKNDEKTKEGNFFTVTEAYEKSYLTREQVMSIAYYHNGGRSQNEEIMSEDYQPLLKTPEKLSEVTEVSLRQTYIDHRWKEEDLKANEELAGEKLQVTIFEYNGTYGDCIAVMMTDNFTGYTCALWTEQVGDINIQYSDGNGMLIWIKTEETRA